MSHFSRLKTRFKNRQILLLCLQEMGYETLEHTMIQGTGDARGGYCRKNRKRVRYRLIRTEEGTMTWWRTGGM